MAGVRPVHVRSVHDRAGPGVVEDLVVERVADQLQLRIGLDSGLEGHPDGERGQRHQHGPEMTAKDGRHESR